MNRDARVWLSFACFVALSFAAYFLTKRGAYGWTLFVMLPFIAGGLGTWSFQPLTMGRAREDRSLYWALWSAACSLLLALRD